MDSLDREVCYRALLSRDARFDGKLFVGVTSTGIFCRPICPARTARPEHCIFFPSAAAAHAAGFRPCLRCRPETAPELASWHGSSNTVRRALALIAEGELALNHASVEALAEKLGVGGRHLRRLFQRHLGASPLSVAQTHRVLFANKLIAETQMPMARVALASGFGSVRRFNETFGKLYGRPPSALRRKRSDKLDASSADVVELRLPYRPPYDFDAFLAHLGARAVAGVEEVTSGTYRRTIAIGERHGTICVADEPTAHRLLVTVRFPSVRELSIILSRAKQMFDVDADIEAINAHLSKNPMLAPLVAIEPGLRSPGAWDAFELAVRAVLGQGVTLAAARKLVTELVRSCGETLPSSVSTGRLTHVFPTPDAVCSANLDGLGVPSTRRGALQALARAACDDDALFRPSRTLDDTVRRLCAIPGVGEWTAQYIALRAMRETDAFPAGDAGLLRAAASGGKRPSPRELLRLAEAWRPWRGYAAEHLWRGASTSTQRAQQASFARQP